MGDGGGESYDAAYNERMASVAEQYAAMAEEDQDFWESDYKPMEAEMIAANREMIPVETALQKATMGQQMEAMEQREPVRNQIYESALSYNPDNIVDTAVNDVMQSYSGALAAGDRHMASRGVNLNSGQSRAMANDQSINLAKTIGAVKSQARNLAEEMKDKKLYGAMSVGV
jgi:hypothetical protein